MDDRVRNRGADRLTEKSHRLDGGKVIAIEIDSATKLQVTAEGDRTLHSLRLLETVSMIGRKIRRRSPEALHVSALPRRFDHGRENRMGESMNELPSQSLLARDKRSRAIPPIEKIRQSKLEIQANLMT